MSYKLITTNGNIGPLYHFLGTILPKDLKKLKKGNSVAFGQMFKSQIYQTTFNGRTWELMKEIKRLEDVQLLLLL